ncbi:hypothetical protein J4206_00430 [Candidatus Woesearchaeota archaeon]|nr:hypothetical protein [Candidatus Woesearchaeota archaeon]
MTQRNIHKEKETDIRELLKVGIKRELPNKTAEKDRQVFLKAGETLNPDWPEPAGPILITETDDTYPIQPNVWDNWVAFAYMAFDLLANEIYWKDSPEDDPSTFGDASQKGKIESFAAIGTSNGADAIGALQAFHDLEQIVITDISSKALRVAKQNLRRYLDARESDCEMIARHGNLCSGLKDLKVDVVYENLPNIPNGNTDQGYRAATFHNKSLARKVKLDESKAVDRDIVKYLLLSHYALLLDAKQVLNDGGSVICAIGGRVPYGAISEMIKKAGYEFEELFSGFKLQTETEEVLQGYAAAEQKYGVKFDFYDFKQVSGLLAIDMEPPYTKLPGDELKKMLGPLAISAEYALRLYRKNPSRKFGHVVHMVRAVKRD